MEGMRFGRLTVVGVGEHLGPTRRWRCRCDCGETVDVKTASLNNGKTTSCGCFHRERLADSAKVANTTHGLYNTTEYQSWNSIRNRCTNPNRSDYPRYGGRGITVCSEWLHSFETFLKDMGHKPTPKHSVERMDNEGPYCKENCRWATPKDQANNRRSNRTATMDGVTKTIAEWSGEYGINYKTFAHRLDRGWSIRKALNLPD